MTTENNISDNQENELDLNQKNTANTPEELETNDLTLKPEPEIKVENPVNEDENLSETAILEEHEVNAKSELEKESLSINEEISQKMPSADEIEVSHGSEKPKESANEKPEIPEKKPEILGSETTPQKSEVYHETPQEQISTDEILKKLESIVNLKDSGAHYKEFNSLKEQIQNIIHKESDAAKSKHSEEDAQHYAHPATAKLNGILQIYREKQDAYHKSLELQQVENLKNRQAIIDRLKNLYTNSEAGTNLFKAIREIKEEWGNAGQVAKNEFKLLNNNYFFHLQQFYEMLDMNKEFLGQEFAHNLEKRQHIISRSKELLEETSVQKALNELQYLHKLWKEEGEPVAEEFRESTWLEFKDISNKIHDRKAELFTQIDSEQAENLTKKNEIIAKMRVISSPEKEVNHNYWQQSIKKIEDLRTEFLKLGSVPKKLSNQNWADFKEVLRVFNLKKNDFYKGLKSSQQDNLNKKLSLIQTASDNMNSDDWETIVPLFKNLQEEWKKIGHVPRSQADKIWTDFRAACNTFFNNFREKNNVSEDNWKDNLKQKNEILAQLKNITDEDGSVEKIEELKSSWNKVGKVPRENLSINGEFNKTLREKLKLNKINEFDLKEEGLSEAQLSDKARKIKNQISDLETEIVKLGNNLGFFADSSRNNPLLKETYVKIDDKKAQLESLKITLHQIISGE
jgi:hypothetical protein